MNGLISWLAGKAGKLMMAGLALAGAILIPVAAVQHITINGWPFFGGGLRGQVAALTKEIHEPVHGYIAQLARVQGNADAFEGGLKACNAGIDALAKEGLERTARAEAALAVERAKSQALSRRVGALLAQQPASADLCAEADNLIRENVR